MKALVEYEYAMSVYKILTPAPVRLEKEDKGRRITKFRGKSIFKGIGTKGLVKQTLEQELDS